MSRIDKVQEELRHHVSQIIQKELNDPRIGFVTIMHIEVSPDLRYAKVFFSVLNKEASLANTIKGLGKAAGFIRKRIGESMRIRYTPKLRFIYDDSGEQQRRIEDIINNIHQEDAKDADR